LEKKNIFEPKAKREWHELSKLAQAHPSSKVAVAMFSWLKPRLIQNLKDENDKPTPNFLSCTLTGILLRKYSDKNMALTVLRDKEFLAMLHDYPEEGPEFIAELRKTHSIQDSELSSAQTVTESEEEISASDIAKLKLGY
jgi:hypothetical protein